MKERILLVEDDPNLGFVIKDNLQSQHYEVLLFNHGLKAKEAFKLDDYDLCILDVMLPGIDGFELARHIRSLGTDLPILFITARDNEADRIDGFELGGDDYIVKPFSIKELLLRVRVFLRRSGFGNESNEHYQLGNAFFDHQNLLLQSGDTSNKLTRREADLLYYLLKNKNQLCKREDILTEIWGDDDYFLGRSLDVFISRLRKLFENESSVKITNHHGVGFMLKC